MKKTLTLLAALVMISALPATAARELVVPIEHAPIPVYQCYPGDSEAGNLGFAGYDGERSDVIGSVPGILSIEPGADWANFVGAFRDQVRYSIKNVVLTKTPGEIIQCWDRFPTDPGYQHGTPNLRLWWPLMYEVPGTIWKLSILYGTYSPYDDDGPGPNPASYVHQEIWRWELAASAESMQCLLTLFHQVPLGTTEVPLVSSESLYPVLQEQLQALHDALDAGQMPQAGAILEQFDLDVNDACRNVAPLSGPAPDGLEMGLVNTPENPACCKLMTDAEYVGRIFDIWQPVK